jgi:hypothetical protein
MFNIWVWSKNGKKKPVFVFEKFLSSKEFKEWMFNLILEMEEGKKIELIELPSCAEGWSSFKLTYIET